jgi:hypothetical protein
LIDLSHTFNLHEDQRQIECKKQQHFEPIEEEKLEVTRSSKQLVDSNFQQAIFDLKESHSGIELISMPIRNAMVLLKIRCCFIAIETTFLSFVNHS